MLMETSHWLIRIASAGDYNNDNDNNNINNKTLFVITLLVLFPINFQANH